MKINHSRILSGLIILLLAALACNLPTTSQGTPDTVVIYVTETSAPPPLLETVTPNAPASTIAPPITHVLYPADAQTAGGLSYDVDSRGTAPEHRAPYGDSHKINLFERPFTQNVMDYIPDLDILTFRINTDSNWYYVFMELGSVDPATGTLTGEYAVELDIDRDGHGDYLIWTKPPFTTSWKTDGITVFTDTNNDTGGLSPNLSDAPFNGNGYDSTIVDSGQGADPDLAWVRIDPRSPTTIQFAFKKSLAGNAFMWGVWADMGIRDPKKFSYNDHFTEVEGGSPEKSEPQFYPIKAIYAVDNTCREAYGFNPTGDEPLLCPREKPTPEPHLGCTNPNLYHDAASCNAAGCAWRQDPTVIFAVIYHCTFP
jgi:hypothetical protein